MTTPSRRPKKRTKPTATVKVRILPLETGVTPEAAKAGASKQLDPFADQYGLHGLIEPPYPYSYVQRRYDDSDVLQSAVDAMVVNTRSFGVQFVPDVAPFEHMKIRILNGGHATIAYPAALLDIHFVHEAMENALVRGFLEELPFRRWVLRLTKARAAVLSPDLLLASAKAGIAEGFLSGVTTYADTCESGVVLQALVENSIKHGLEPQREGGRIDVVVQRLPQDGGECLRVQVRDTGKGLSDAPVQAGGGVGLTNLRERLAA